MKKKEKRKQKKGVIKGGNQRKKNKGKNKIEKENKQNKERMILSYKAMHSCICPIPENGS